MNTKLLLAATAAIFAASTAAQAQVSATYPNQPSPLSGVYLGGYGGYGWNSADTAANDFDVNGGDYGLFAGYQLDALMDRTLGLGINGAIEFHYGWSDAEDDITVAGTTVGIEKNNEWGISFRPGLSFVDQYAPFGIKPYGIIGYRQAEFEAVSGGVSSEESFDGFELGLGTELMAYNDFGVRVDYTHVWYGEEGGIDPDEDDIRLGVAYHF